MSNIVLFVKWLLIVVIGLPILLYLILISLNFNDEKKSDTVIKFEHFLTKRNTQIDDENNGFVYAAGLAAANSDFYLMGMKNITQANRIKSLPAKPNEQNHLYISKINTNYSSLVAVCERSMALTKACHDHLLGQTQEIDKFLADSSLILQRYKTMISQPQWYESLQFNTENSLTLSPWSTGYKVFMLYIWREASKGNVELMTQLLQQNSVFLRNAMRSTHSLLNLMFMSSLMQEDYRWGAFIMHSFLASENIEKVTPKDWHISLINKVFSFEYIVIGEWQVASSLFNEMNQREEWFSIFIRPLFNVQSTLNLYAEALLSSSNLNHEKVSSSVINTCQQALSLSMLSWYTYNPIGKLLVCVGTPNLGQYLDEVNETEILRLETVGG